MKFKQYYLTEKKAHPEFYETAVVRAWNGQTVRKDVKPFVDEVVKQLKSKQIKGKATQVGRNQVPTTSKWQRFDKKTKDTSKTDIRIGDNDISIKLKPSAQLMSGFKGEAEATFMHTVEHLKTKPNINSMVKEVQKEFEQFKRGMTKKGTITKVLARKSDKDVLDLDKLHKKITTNLINVMNADERIGMGFVKEAMSGYNKFGKETPHSADYVLAFTRKGDGIGLNSVSDKKYLKKILGHTNLTVSFKSNKQPKGYAYWSAMRLDWKQFKEGLQAEYDGQLLTEGIISNAIERVKQFFLTTFQNIYNFISKSFTQFLQFFGLTAQIAFNNNVAF